MCMLTLRLCSFVLLIGCLGGGDEQLGVGTAPGAAWALLRMGANKNNKNIRASQPHNQARYSADQVPGRR